MRIRKTTLLLVTTAAFTASLASSAVSQAQDMTTFRGRFACAQGGAPLAGASVQLQGIPPSSRNGSDRFAATYNAVAAGADGEWSFSVPRDSNQSFYVRVSLTGGGVAVDQYPTLSPVEWATDSNYNDVAVQDYGTQPVPGVACPLWVALKDARRDYRRITGHEPPNGDVVAQYGGPNVGSPYTAYLTIVWPTGHPVTAPEARHEFAHTIRNATMPEWRWLQEVQDGDFRERSSPCRRTSERYAFHEGWAEFWARDFSPAPVCFGDQEVSEPTYEGAVAWTLTRLERSCAAYSRRHLVEVLLNRGGDIHTLHDLMTAVGSCQAAPLSPGAVPRYSVPKPTVNVWSKDVQASIKRERGQITTLTKLLPQLDKAAATASCARPPCTSTISRRVAPILARGEIAQARVVLSSLTSIATRAAADLHRDPSRTTVDLVTKVPATLVKRTAATGLTTMTKALAVARPLARGDGSAATKALISTLTSFRSAYLRSSRTGASLPPGTPDGTPPPTTQPSDTQHRVTFDGISDGATITTQTAAAGVTFGGPPALHFPGRPPIYLCPTGPIAAQNAAISPACSAPGGLNFGTMARFAAPARSVVVRVGTTHVIPGGLPIELDAFDAEGNFIGGNAILAGSSTNGQPAGPVTPLGVKAPSSSHPIAFIALFVNSTVYQDTKLVFDDLVFTT